MANNGHPTSTTQPLLEESGRDVCAARCFPCPGGQCNDDFGDTNNNKEVVSLLTYMMQDMKCVCVQYLAAIRRLIRAGFQPTRTVLLSFVPDEEIGGNDGINLLLSSPEWKAVQPIGIAMDEGLANPRDAFTVFYGERTPWWLLIKAEGSTGHGSRFIKGTAVEKLMAVCDKALAFRKEQEEALGHTGGCSHAKAKKLGDVTTLNLTMLKAGVAMAGGGGGDKAAPGEGHERFALNVIPTEARAGFDVRISPNTPTEAFRARVSEWCREEGVTWEFADWTTPLDTHYLTSIDRDKNPWWGVFLVSVCCDRQQRASFARRPVGRRCIVLLWVITTT